MRGTKPVKLSGTGHRSALSVQANLNLDHYDAGQVTLSLQIEMVIIHILLVSGWYRGSSCGCRGVFFLHSVSLLIHMILFTIQFSLLTLCDVSAIFRSISLLLMYDSLDLSI